MAMARSADFKTPTCRFSYVHNMFTPVKKVGDDGKPVMDKNGEQVIEWQVSLIFPVTTDRTVFDEAIKSVILEQWGDAGLVRAKNGMIKTPYLPGDGPEARNKKTGELHPGMGADIWFIRTSTRREPPIRYKSGTIPAKKDEIKSGDYGFTVLNAYAWNNPKKGDGVSFGIQYLQKKTDGESLGGGSGIDVDTYYEEIADAGGAPASTTAGKGASGLFG